jgi:uncharacterized membrane protein YdjX (TVP38/TMEM64 family)
MQKKIPAILGTITLIVFFILAEVVAHTYSLQISAFIKNKELFGQLFFVMMAALAVIIPVWSNMFLIPISVVAFGSLTTALLCISGWWIGSVTSFFIARMYKEWLLKQYSSLRNYQFIDSYIPKNRTILSLIFLRMTIPVDVLSYALGLFSTRISWQQNAATTLIGITPFSFIFSYIGLFSAKIQFIVFTITALLFFIYIALQKKK